MTGALATSDNSDELRRCSDELRRSPAHRIASLCHLLHQPYELVTVDLTQDTITITPV